MQQGANFHSPRYPLAESVSDAQSPAQQIIRSSASLCLCLSQALAHNRDKVGDLSPLQAHILRQAHKMLESNWRENCISGQSCSNKEVFDIGAGHFSVKRNTKITGDHMFDMDSVLHAGQLYLKHFGRDAGRKKLPALTLYIAVSKDMGNSTFYQGVKLGLNKRT